MFAKLFSLQRVPKEGDSTWTVIPKTLLKGDNSQEKQYHKNNLIKTTKYTMLNFLPKNLFEQFHRFANLYFLFIIVLNFIPQINAFLKEISMIPLIVVLSITAIKDLVEDRQRYLSDKVVNNRLCDVYDVNGKGKFHKKKWRTLEVGDIIKLENNDIIPCDILLLNTSDEDGICHISTANLDGENNLKQKKIPKGFFEEESQWSAEQITFQVKCEPPNNQLHKFFGYIVQQPNGEEIGVDKNNLLLRGCVLKNTDHIYGLVIYAGHDTKSMLNDSGTRYKRSQIEKDINKDVLSCVIILLLFCLIGSIGCGHWQKNYVAFEKTMSVDGAEESYEYEGFLRFWTFIIILQVIIPISLYVSVEIVKLGQVFFINRDLGMFYEETAQYPVCRSTNITEDLGQIDYIFSDKTGTLTENIMVFKRFAILGINCLHPEGETDEIIVRKCKQEQEKFCKDNGPKAFELWDDFFTTLAISNTVVVAKQPDTSDGASIKAKISQNNLNTKLTVNDTITENSSTQNGFCNSSTLTVPGMPEIKAIDQTDSKIISDNTSCDSMIESYESRQRTFTYSRPLSDRLSRSVESISSWLDIGLFPEYEFESPDEGALVKAASQYGYTLANRTPDQILFTGLSGEIKIYDILQILQFDSVRKRMSVIVRDDRGKIKVYCKGADTEVLSNLKAGQDHLQQLTNDRLEDFAREGLRTLCIAKKDLTEEEYNKWLEKHKEAELALEDRDEKLSASASLIETDLMLLGATGIEDKLQAGVPETIAGLKEAGINLWILTGDKQETAVNIGFSCKVLDASMEIITINSSNKEECNELLDEIMKGMNARWPSCTVLPTTNSGVKNEELDRPPMALIIDGVSLSFALSKPLDTKFIEIAKQCESVICCRAAPLQKAAVVKLVRENLKVMTLAIGDGANDVSMLQMAEIGVGIAGKEGIQAVMASDFVVGRFQFLKRLLLLHGFWCYDRITRMVLYFFYKNTMFIGVLFWFNIYNGFSGSNAIDDISLILFNLLFTSIPPIICGVWDQCLPEEAVLSKPILYRLGQEGKLYTRKLYWINIVDAMFQSVVLFFIPYLTFSDLPFGMVAGGVTFHQLAVITANLHIGIEIPNWTVIHAVITIGSVVVSFLYYFIYCAVDPKNVQHVYWAIFNAMALPEFWLLIIFCPTFALLPRLLVRVLRTTYQPTVMQQARLCVNGKDGELGTTLRTLSDSSLGHRHDKNYLQTAAPT